MEDKPQELSDKLIELFKQYNVEIGFITFMHNNESIAVLHGDFYEVAKLACFGVDGIKNRVKKDLKL